MFVNLDKFQDILSDKQKSQQTGSKITVGSHEIQVAPSDDVVGVTIEVCNFIKKETLAQVFACEFCEISKNTFFAEHLWTTASGISVIRLKKLLR